MDQQKIADHLADDLTAVARSSYGIEIETAYAYAANQRLGKALFPFANLTSGFSPEQIASPDTKLFAAQCANGEILYITVADFLEARAALEAQSGRGDA